MDLSAKTVCSQLEKLKPIGPNHLSTSWRVRKPKPTGSGTAYLRLYKTRRPVQPLEKDGFEVMKVNFIAIFEAGSVSSSTARQRR